MNDRQRMINAIVEERRTTYGLTADAEVAMRRSLDIAIPAEQPRSMEAPVTLAADDVYAVAARNGFGVAAKRRPEDLIAVRSCGVWSGSPEMVARALETEQFERDRMAAFDAAFPPETTGGVVVRTIAKPS